MGVYDLIHCKENVAGDYACARVGGISGLYIVTFCIVTAAAIRLARQSKKKIPLKLLIVLLGVIELFTGIINYTFYSSVVLAFSQMWFKLLQYNIITYYFVRAASRLKHSEWMDDWLLKPGLGVLCLGVTVLYLVAIFGLTVQEDSCADPAWIMMSGTSMALALLFLTVAIFMTIRMKGTSLSEGVRRRQRFQLWLLVGSNLLASSFHLGYDLYLRNSEDCEGMKGPTVKDVFFFVLGRAISRLVPALAAAAAFSLAKSDRRRAYSGPQLTLDSYYENLDTIPRRDSVGSPRAHAMSYIPPWAQSTLDDSSTLSIEDQRALQTR